MLVCMCTLLQVSSEAIQGVGCPGARVTDINLSYIVLRTQLRSREEKYTMLAYEPSL